MLGTDDALQSAAHIKVAHHLEAARLRFGHEIIKNAVDHALIEDAVITEAPEVELQALELNTHIVRHIGNVDGREVGCAPLQERELRRVRLNTTQRTQ